jgi:hypothetical protein
MRITTNNINDIFKAKKCSIETMELKGYELIDNLFVDNSGFGTDSEPALTANSFIDKVLQIIANEKNSVYATITDAGQFQVYVGLFRKTGKSKVKKIANNTYDVIYSENKHAIRLHDTDIITFDNGKIILNSGGWKTHTTKSRINQYLPRGVYVSQKDFEWFVNDSRDNTVKPFENGMTIAS